MRGPEAQWPDLEAGYAVLFRSTVVHVLYELIEIDCPGENPRVADTAECIQRPSAESNQTWPWSEVSSYVSADRLKPRFAGTGSRHRACILIEG